MLAGCGEIPEEQEEEEYKRRRRRRRIRGTLRGAAPAVGRDLSLISIFSHRCMCAWYTIMCMYTYILSYLFLSDFKLTLRFSIFHSPFAWLPYSHSLFLSLRFCGAHRRISLLGWGVCVSVLNGRGRERERRYTRATL